MAQLTITTCATAVLAAALSALTGCSSCRGDQVPFKRGASAAADGGAAAVAANQVRAGTAYPAGTTQVELGGQQLKLAAGSVRAALDLDLDGDGAAEALLVTEDETGLASLQLSRRGATGWDAPQLVATFALPEEHCAVAAIGLEQLDPSYALARAELWCGGAAAMPAAPAAPVAPVPQEGAAPAAPGAPGVQGAAPSAPNPPAPPGTPPAPAPAAAAPKAAPAPQPAAGPQPAAAPPGAAPPAGTPPAAPPTPPSVRRVLWVLTVESSPRVLERLVLPAADDLTGPQLDAVVRAGDLDGDGHSDLALALDVKAAEGGAALAATHVELRWWNRAGGLARDRAEPEQTLLALADEAKTARKRKPSSAAQLARQALAAYGALCRESGSARLGVDGGQGFECGSSLAAGRAGSVLAAVLAGEGKLLDALERYQALRSPLLKLTDNDWERVQSALQTRVEKAGFSWKEGPAVALPPGSALRLGLAAFLDERHVLLRGPAPRSYDLDSGQSEPIGVHGATLIMDPGARFALSAVVHACEGEKLAVVRVAQVLEGMVSGPPVSEPLIEPARITAGVPCLPGALATRDDHGGGFRPLAWTAQGVLLTRGAQLWLLALDESANASAPARLLAPDAALPKLPYSGEVSSDGRLHALLTPLGVALFERASGHTRLIALPEGAGPAPTDLAISPSGKALAIVRGGKLFVASIEGATLAPAPSAAAPVSVTHEAPPAP